MRFFKIKYSTVFLQVDCFGV